MNQNENLSTHPPSLQWENFRSSFASINHNEKVFNFLVEKLQFTEEQIRMLVSLAKRYRPPALNQKDKLLFESKLVGAVRTVSTRTSGNQRFTRYPSENIHSIIQKVTQIFLAPNQFKEDDQKVVQRSLSYMEIIQKFVEANEDELRKNYWIT